MRYYIQRIKILLYHILIIQQRGAIILNSILKSCNSNQRQACRLYRAGLFKQFDRISFFGNTRQHHFLIHESPGLNILWSPSMFLVPEAFFTGILKGLQYFLHLVKTYD